ncbi:MAG TPA: hypothetical protein VHX43_16925 [Xanthobacteraceae bacterium]|nr:hypothetical protein [Xanthobacteraceae bacterium]
MIGGWHPLALRAAGDASAAAAVALRFPQAWDAASAASPGAATAAAVPASGVVADPEVAQAVPANSSSDAELALLDPAPMIPQRRPQPESPTSQQPAPQPAVQVASAEDAALPPSPPDANAVRRPQPEPMLRARAQRPVKISATPAERRAMDRPGYMFDDAQIASIKERLHLTPDQEQMWPAVEAALRNIAYTRAQQARDRRRGVVQTGDIDPDSVANLKSAAVPLIMSFNDDQKQEVRDLAHVMGLDQLASEF